MFGGRGFPRRQVNDIAPPVFSGLSSNANYANYARIGTLIDVLVNGLAPDAVEWGSVSGGNQYGSSLSLNVPGTDDTGNPNAPAELWARVTMGAAVTDNLVGFIRCADPVESVPANISTTGISIGDVVTMIPSDFGILPAHTRVATLFSTDETLDVGDGSANLTHTIDANEDDERIDGSDVLTCSAGIFLATVNGAFDVADFVEPAESSAPVVTIAKIGFGVGFNVPVFTGNPTPSIVYETLINGSSVGDENYVIVEADDLDNISIHATASNGIGSAAVSTSATVQVTYNVPIAAGGLADQSFTEDTDVQTLDPTGDFSVSGDADLSGTGWTLPTTVAGVTINPTTGLISFDTDALSPQSSTAIVVRGTNSGGSDDSAFSLEITEVVATPTITFTSGTYTRGAAGVAPTLDNTDIIATATTGPYFLDVLTVTNGTTPSQADMDNGSGAGVIEKITLGPEANIEDLAGPGDPNVSVTNGRIYQQYRDSSGTPTLSALTSAPLADSINYDAVAPAFSSAVVKDADPDRVVITLTKAAYDPNTTLSAGDFSLTGFTVSSASLFNTTTVHLQLSTDVVDTDDLTGDLGYTGNDLVGIDAEVMATFSGEDVSFGAFTPSDDVELVAHYDASDVSSVTLDGATVTAIADQTANSFDLSENSIAQTGLTVGTQNSLATIEAAGGSDDWINGLVTLPLDGNVAFHGVMRVDTITNANEGLFGLTTGTFFDIQSGNASQFDGRIEGGAISNTDFTGGPFSGWINFSIIFDATAQEAYCYVGNTLRATATGYTTALASLNTLNILANRFSGDSLDGALAEFCISGDITNRSDFYNYLNTKWNVS